MSQRVYMSKRRRRDLDSSSSSNSSDCTNDKYLWEFSGDNYEFLMNDDFMEHCKHDSSTMDNSAPVDNSLQSCISLLKDLSHLLHNIRQRSQSGEPENFRKYSETILTNEIQHYERRKNKVVNSILSAVRDKCQTLPSLSSSSSSPSNALDFTATTNLISNQEIDQNSSQLLRALGEFQLEWEAIVHQITPVNPLTNKTKFVKDIEQDLQKIDAWLDMLASNLPNTSAWMTCLMSLSEVQKFSAAKYYQICLKQIEQYSKTLSTIKELVDRVDVHTMNADLSFQNTLHHLSKQFCQAEAKCHTLWLRLLELTIYIDQNLKINISTNNTEQREEKLIENSWNIHLLAFTSQEVKHQNEHESGFESEQSPPVKLSLPYACSETAISSNIKTQKDGKSLLHKKNSHSLPNDFNKITKQMITNSLSNNNNDNNNNNSINDNNEETRKHPEGDFLHQIVKSTSTSPKNIYNAYNSEHTVCNDNNSNNENIDVISLPDQDNLKLLTRTYEKILFDNTSNNSDGKASQDGESFLTDPNSSTDAVLIGFSKRKHDNVDEGKQTLPEEANKIEDLKSNRQGIIIHKCSSLPVIISPSISSLSSSSSPSSSLSMLTGEEFEILPTSLSIKTRSLRVKRTTSVSSVSLVYKRKNNKSFNRYTYTSSHNKDNSHNNDNNIENCTKITNEQRSFTNKYKAHNLYCLKRLTNRQLKINSSRDFSLKQKTLKWKSKSSEILKQNLIKQLKTSSHRNCKSSLCLNKSLQSSSRNVSIRHSKCIESNANNEMIQSTDFNSDHDTMSNHSYHCKSPSSSSPSQSSSLPDDASELEQRRWKMQVKTYLNAAAQAEQLIRSKYSPTTQPRTTTTPPTTTTTITEQFKSWLAGVNASSNAKLRNRNKQDKQSKKYIKENTNNNEEILIDVSDGTKFPNMKQSKQHSHINNVWDSQFQASTNNNNVDTEEGEDGDDDDDEEASDIKANKDGDDSNEPLNFWDDYQASLYSNTSDVQAYESPRTYAEEFPWDDEDSSLFLIDDDNNDADDGDDDGKELKSTSTNSCTESFYKLIQSLSNNDSHDGDYGQDTMDIISTSTSALFHLKSNISSSIETSLDIDQNNHRNNNNNRPFNNSSQRLESCSPEYTSNLLTSPNPSIHGLRTCPDGGSQYLPMIETMDIVSDTNAKGFNNDPVNNFNLCLSSPYSMYYRKQQQQKVVVPSAYDKKSQTIPRTTFASTAATTNSSPLTATGKTRKRKAQMTLFHSPSDSQCIKREFLSFDNNLNCCLQNDRNFSDIHKGILEHSETRLSNAENYLQHLLIAMRKNSKANRRDRLNRSNSGNWRHRTTHLLQTAEAHIKLLSNLLDDLKHYSPDTSEFSEDDHRYSFIEDLTRNTSNNSKSDHLHHHNNNNNNSVDIHCQQSQNPSSYQLMISEAMKLKCQWGKFLSKVHGIHHQSNQYEIWEKQLCLLQIRMHELSRLTREIGLSMYINKDGCHHDNDDDDGSDKTVDDANNYNTSKLLNNAKQMDRISCGFKRCFSELDSLSYALNEIQSELTEKCRTSVNSNNNNNNNNTNDNTRNNSSMLSSSMINLDSQLLHEIEHLSSQLAVNRSILQRLIRLFESNCSSHSTRKHDRQQENVMEEQLDTTTITNPTESILQCLQNETSEPNTNEHLNQCEPENNPSVISVSNTVENKKSSIFSTILKMIHHIFPFGKHHFLIVLTGGFLFIVYMGFYIFSRSVICNNNNDNNSASRPLPSSSSTSPVSSSSSIPLTSSTSASHHDHNNNNNFNDFTAATANAYHKCPLDRDRLSNIFDYTNGMPPY